MDDKDRIIAELREQIEELETRVSTLDIAVAHWREMYRNLDLLYSQLAGRG
jgi:chaperonin cofactor prefoldin